jgi:hypothetical protein
VIVARRAAVLIEDGAALRGVSVRIAYVCQWKAVVWEVSWADNGVSAVRALLA